MKLVLLSDLHLSWQSPTARLDDVRQTQMEKLEFVLNWAEDNEAVVLQAGDFFDRPRSWYLLPEVMRLLREHEEICPIYLVYGQHDTYLYSEQTKAATSLGVLAEAGLVEILTREYTFIYPNVALYGASYGQEVPVQNDFDEHDSCIKVLVIHAPISMEAVYPGQDYIYAKKFLALRKDYDLILCGDIHRMAVVQDHGRWLVNTGPMVRRTADKYNFTHKPCFFVYDTDKKDVSMVEIPHKPAEEVLSREHIETKEESNKMLEEFISSVNSEVVSDVSFEENLWAFIKGNEIDQEVIDVLAEVMNEGE